jgi:hypothetical protein
MPSAARPAWWPGAAGQWQLLRPLVAKHPLACFAASWGAWVAADAVAVHEREGHAVTDAAWWIGRRACGTGGP